MDVIARIMKKPSIILLTILLAVNQVDARPISTCMPNSISIETGNGVATFSVEVADTEDERSIGLMFRPYLPIEHSMLFIWPDSEPRKFWMKNTFISLDMIFFNKDGKICNIKRNASPQSEETINSDCSSQFVLEINGGLADRLGIEMDSNIYHQMLSTCK